MNFIIKFIVNLLRPFMGKRNILQPSKVESLENPILKLFEAHEQKKKNNLKEKQSSTSDSDLDFPDAYTFRTSPKYINGTLRDYQIEGVNWLISMHEKNVNCILADEMGLGKTLQTITFLGYLKNFLHINNPHLLIVPKSLLHNWKAEFKKFLPSFKVFTFHTQLVEIRNKQKEMENTLFDVVLTTYEMCISAKNVFKHIKWCYLVIDEAHRIKNEESLLSRIVRILNVEHRFLLTGTPLQNNVRELWALLNFLDPNIFTDGDNFEKWIVELEQNCEDGIEQLRKVLQLFFLRREKRDVETALLPKKIINLYPKLTNMQRTLYKQILQKDLSPILGEKKLKSRLINIVIQLRKCCNHPYLFDGMEPGPPWEEGEHLVQNAGKMIYLDKLLIEMSKKGSRVLIFSQMTSMLDIIEDFCSLRDYECRRIDGSTGAAERGEYIDEFNAPNSEIFIFLLSTRAGGLGINLATADVVVMYDSDWNPQIDLQAQDRAHRIGQTKQVYVFKFITENTIEEKIIHRALKKLKLDEILVQKNKNISQNINEGELYDILAEGVEKIFDKDEEANDGMNIEEIIKIGEERTKKLNSELENITLSESQAHNLEIYEFEGEDYKNKTKLQKFFHSDDRRATSLIFKPKPVVLPDFQFYPNELKEIIAKEEEAYEKNMELDKIDQQRKEELMKQGFGNWSKRDFSSFLKAVEIFGANNIEKYTEYVDKELDEIIKYNETFWSRIDELSDKNKILLQFAKSAEKKKRDQIIHETLKKIFEKKDSVRIKNLVYTRSKNFNEQIDFMILEEYYKKHQNVNYIDDVLIRLKRMYPFNFSVRVFTVLDLKKRLKILKQNILKISKTLNDL